MRTASVHVRSGNVTAVVGAQYGSEGKGAVVADLAKRGEFGAYVRTGGPNAGHTFYHGGRKWVSRSLPVGWIDPAALLVIGPGAVINSKLLLNEIQEVEDAGYRVRDRLIVDYRAGVLTHAQEAAEGGVHGNAHGSIGSTGEGVGIHRMARINRGSLMPTIEPEWGYQSAADDLLLADFLGDAVERLTSLRKDDMPVCLEGTQGQGLSLTTGVWPFVTSADTSSAQLAADAGVPASSVDRTLLVARTFPIRVAGNSGPLYGETSFEEIGVPPEVTTVTKKTRRVGTWDAGLVRHAVLLNSPCKVVLTFADYMWPELRGLDRLPSPDRRYAGWLADQAVRIEAGFCALGTGPETLVWL